MCDVGADLQRFVLGTDVVSGVFHCKHFIHFERKGEDQGAANSLRLLYTRYRRGILSSRRFQRRNECLRCTW